ncbi:hypothetical protein SOVF_108030 [Spinacia oleracea]|nr:hypothetical protein SOVF_108030 [Spinacia oleracea]
MEPSYYISKTLHYLTFLQFLLLKTVLADSEPNYFYTICDKNGNYTKNSIYQNNLNHVLSDLGTQTAGTSFHNSTSGETPDKAYGMFYCRADIDPALCQSCVQSAKKQIVNVNCTNQKEGVIWYQECTLRYANRPLNSLYEVDPPTSQAFSQSSVSDPIQFQQVVTKTMNNLVQKAAKNNTYNGYATAETAVIPLPPTNTLYSLVQCTPDIFGLQCEKCLLGLLKYINVNAPNSTMVMFFRSNCQMRYDSVPFYSKLSLLPIPSSQQPSQSLSNKDIQNMDQNRAGKGILFYTIISVVPAAGLILLFLCIIAFCVYRRRKKQSTPTAAGKFR